LCFYDDHINTAEKGLNNFHCFGAENTAFMASLSLQGDRPSAKNNIYTLADSAPVFCRYDLRKYYFTIRVVPIWNSLDVPNSVVSADSINIFKSRLDKFWKSRDYDFLYDYKAQP